MRQLLLGYMDSKSCPERRNGMLKINGETYDYAGKTVSEMVELLGYNPQLIAVERNEEIVPKASYSETVLEDEDVIEVVSYVGGG